MFAGTVYSNASNNSYEEYDEIYDSLVTQESPILMDLEMVREDDSLRISVSTLTEEDLTTTRNILHYLLTYDRIAENDSIHFREVIGFEAVPFELVNEGQEGIFSHTFAYPDSLEEENIFATVFIQNLRDEYIILQAGETPLGENVSIDNEIEITQIGLNSYPNPFVEGNSRESIKFTLESDNLSSNGKISIFNMKGQKEKELFFPKNSKVIEWIPENISSGVYFYKYSNDDFQSKIHKLIFMK